MKCFKSIEKSEAENIQHTYSMKLVLKIEDCTPCFLVTKNLGALEWAWCSYNTWNFLEGYASCDRLGLVMISVLKVGAL